MARNSTVLITDIPRIIASAFQIKMQEIQNSILKNVLGKVLAYVRVIEFQKRVLVIWSYVGYNGD